jgi:Ca2+-transporting ATPase
MFGYRTLGLSILQGMSVLIIVMAIFAFSYYRGYGEGTIRANVFTTLIFANVGLILTNLSWSRNIISTLRSPNRALWWLLASVSILLGLVLYVPFLKQLFLFERISLIDMFACFMAGFISITWFELLKTFRGRQV